MEGKKRLGGSLFEAWDQAVAGGFIKNVFAAPDGRRLEAGVRAGANGPEHYVRDVEANKDVHLPPHSKRFDNGAILVYNPFGKFKPQAPPTGFGRQADLPAGPDACPLRCNDPKDALSILRRPVPLSTALPHSSWLAFANLTPWQPRGLCLWIPGRPDQLSRGLVHEPQRLSPEKLEDFLAIVRGGERMMTFFNSLHAGATVDHIHFQTAYNDAKLAIESAPRTAVGRYTMVRDWPSSALVFPREVSPEELWGMIGKLQTAGLGFNLIALSTGIFLFVRDPEQEVVAEFGHPVGAVEFVGWINSSDMDDFRNLTEERVAAGLRKMTFPPGRLAGLLSDK